MCDGGTDRGSDYLIRYRKGSWQMAFLALKTRVAIFWSQRKWLLTSWPEGNWIEAQMRSIERMYDRQGWWSSWDVQSVLDDAFGRRIRGREVLNVAILCFVLTLCNEPSLGFNNLWRILSGSLSKWRCKPSTIVNALRTSKSEMVQAVDYFSVSQREVIGRSAIIV